MGTTTIEEDSGRNFRVKAIGEEQHWVRITTMGACLLFCWRCSLLGRVIHTLLIPAFGKLRQENYHEFKGSLGYMRFCLKS